MKTFIFNRYCNVFFNKADQDKVVLNAEGKEERSSLCCFEINDDEILFEVIEEKKGKRELIGFRIYKKETIKNVEELIDLLNANNGYWNKEIDKQFPYIAD